MEQITATITTIKFRNDDNGWTVLEAQSQQEKFVAVGVMPTLNAGEDAELYGQWTTHPAYGKQLKVESYSSIAPTSLESVYAYLSSGIVRGVGKSTARSIINSLGSDALDIIENNHKLLMNVPGIGESRAKQIHASFMEKRKMQNIVMGVQELGISLSQGMQIYNLYGTNCVSIIKENPYKLIDDIAQIGFKTADKIARNAGYAHNSDFRIKAGIKYTLSLARQEGHTCLVKDVLLTHAAQSVLDVEPTEVEYIYETMIIARELVSKTIDGEECVFLSYMHFVEMDCAVRLMKLSQNAQLLPLFDIDHEIERIEKSNHVLLAHDQSMAVRQAMQDGMLVITGGPGTGKTTILSFIIEIFERLGLELELAAPTGRAAKRISDTTGREARTIHRLLEYGYGSEHFMRNADNPIDADVIIIDEMSMVDVLLFHALLKAIPDGARLVMVGDADQLPSVGAGNVLRDIVQSSAVSVIKLTEIFRQAGRSMIVVNAHMINKGRPPELVSDPSADFQFYNCPNAQIALDSVITLCKEFAASGKENEIQVLSPMKNSALGVRNLNEKLQNALNPYDESKPQLTYGDMVFRVGDRVIQTKNNYDMLWTKESGSATEMQGEGVFNGDIGTIVEISVSAKLTTVIFDDMRIAEYSIQQLEELELAYCISVHKSQGSEFPCVVLPLISGPAMLFSRNILYTAVTRARNRVYILGTEHCVEYMVSNTHTKRRYSALRTFLNELNEMPA